MQVIIVNYKIKNPAERGPEQPAFVDPALKPGWN